VESRDAAVRAGSRALPGGDAARPARRGYYTTAIGKLHYHPQRNSHGYHQALLDESGRVLSPDFRSDYRSWFWSQAPQLDPDATGIGWNDSTQSLTRFRSGCIPPTGPGRPRPRGSKGISGRSPSS